MCYGDLLQFPPIPMAALLVQEILILVIGFVQIGIHFNRNFDGHRLPVDIDRDFQVM